MKWLDASRIKVVVFGVIVSVLVGGANVWADFVFDAARAEDVPPCGKGESFSHDGLRLYLGTSKLADGYGSYDIGVIERESANAPWGEAVNLGPNINTEHMEGWPTISPDELELYFGRNNWYAMRSTRASKDDPWGPAAEYTGVYPDDFSSDGLTKYTSWDWPGGYGGWDIWVTKRATLDAEWGDPVNLGPNVNNSNDQGGPSISSDGLALFFVSTTTERGLHMCVRPTKDDPWGPAVDVGAPVNSPYWLVFPEISPDGSTLYCNRGGGLGFTQVSIKPIVDLNSDGIVDAVDMCIMVDYWGTDEQLCDIGPMPWGDGVVDAADLEVFMRHWGQEPYDPTLIAHWKLDETDGTTACDSAIGSDGSVNGDPAWEPAGGYVDGALHCDGLDDCVSTPFVLDPGDGPFSVLAWIKGGTPGQVIVSQNSGSDWLAIDSDSGGLMTAVLPTSSRLPKGPLVSDAAITDGLWHRVALVWDGASRSLYVDGTLVAEDEQDSLVGCHGGLNIGCDKDMTPGTFFSGLIDDIRIYNRVVKP